VGAQTLEDFRMIKLVSYVVTFLLLVSCSTLLKYKKSDEFKNTEFEKKVVIIEEPVKEADSSESASGTTTVSGTTVVPPDSATAAATSAKAAPAAPVKPKIVKPKAPAKSKKAAAAKTPPVPTVRQPETEDSEGFNNQRRPPVDPFRVGETITHDVKYLGATAGQMVLKVNPFAVVNGKKSYNFVIELKSTSNPGIALAPKAALKNSRCATS